MQRRRRGAARVPINQKMINTPTITPSVNEGIAPLAPADPYISIMVDTTDPSITEAVPVVLFDASAGYQLGMKVTNHPATKIEGLTAPYQFLLNDLGSSNGSFFDTIQQRIDDGEKAMSQWGRPIELYESSKGSKPRLVATIHPGMGVHEGQYQEKINTFSYPFTVGNRSAFVYMQEPGVKLTWGFYQKAELGRTQ